MPPKSSKHKIVAVCTGALLVLSACSSGSTDLGTSAASEPISVVTAPTNAALVDGGAQLPIETETGPSKAVEIAQPGLTTDGSTPDFAAITSEGVLTAAVLVVSNGDLEGAIASGIVTEAEAEAALAAVENGTLGDYSTHQPRN
ncbi:MAG: hypothetical protein ACKVHU_10105 [Acidimicrobiales bacterium]|jgi:hypothetical protein